MEVECKAEVQVYTDGSVIEGRVGAAAVLYRGDKPVRSARHHLGNQTDYGIYKAEMVAQVLGLRLLQGETGVRSASIAVDSRSTLEALEHTTTGTGEYLLEMIRRECAAAIRRTHHRLELGFRWVPGHEGVEGNERVDEEAKAA
ncbi:ribonuclease H-like protein, partial [Coprinopsis marcescibilis]